MIRTKYIASIFKKAVAMIGIFCCMGTTAFAAEYSTDVVFVGQGVEEYEITTPATLAPGDESQIEINGTWAENRKLTVHVPETVTLTCDIDGKKQTIGVDFSTIKQIGNNNEAISKVANIAIDEMPSDILFGTWRGIIRYSVEMAGAEDHVCLYDEFSTIEEATCNTNGLKERTCSECGNVDEAIIPAFGHTYQFAICTTCGDKEVAGLYDVDGDLLATWDELNINVNGVWTPMYQRNDFYGNDATHASNVLNRYYSLNASRLVVSHNVDTISSFAFAGCADYTIVVPSTVTTIGTNAFANTAHYQYNGSTTIVME